VIKGSVIRWLPRNLHSTEKGVYIYHGDIPPATTAAVVLPKFDISK
jgi:hypothetical protein